MSKLDDILTESEILATVEQLQKVDKNLRERIPQELLFTPDGSPNMYNHYGVILFHIGMARANLRAFL